MKRCPDCAEMVQNQARICRFCKHEFHIGYAPQYREQTKDVQQRRLIGLGLILAILVIGGVGNAIQSMKHPKPDVAAAEAKTKAEPADSVPTGPKPFQVELMARKKLEAALKDPGSAEFRGVRVPRGAAYLCGEVNSRNSFGGFTGYKRFIAGAASEMPVAIEGEQMESTEFENAWTALC